MKRTFNRPFLDSKQCCILALLLFLWLLTHIIYKMGIQRDLQTNKETTEKKELLALKKEHNRSVMNHSSPKSKANESTIRKNHLDKKIVIKRNKKPTIPPPKKRASHPLIDINIATAADFKKIKGIGSVLSKRIVKYRNRLQGFTFWNQIAEVWGLDQEVIKRMEKRFSIMQKPKIKKININKCSFKALLANPYIDYELCKKIFNYKRKNGDFTNLTHLKNINSFPLEKYERIALYLCL